jgi:nucleotide-binding universal stress UspA family protein
MFSKILIATDFSPASDRLLKCAAELKILGFTEAVLAHVMYVANTPGLEDYLREELKPRLERQKCLLEARGIKVVTDVSLGIPARGLEDLAASHEVKAILIGSRGRGLARSALGSVSFKLLQITSFPVFLARIDEVGECEKCANAPALKPFPDILFATDFSGAADRAFIYLEQIVRETGAQITLLHVHDQAHYAEMSVDGVREKKELDRQRLTELEGRLAKNGGRVMIEWVAGRPAEEIIAMTRDGRFSLVVMGQHGKGFIKEAIFGSVANEVARQAEAPVLLVPAIH